MAQPDRALDVSRRKAESLEKADRLRRRSEYRRVQNQGRRVHTPHFTIVVLPRNDSATRLGVTVTKKVGTAVRRNRIRRVVREVFRRNRSLFPAGCDLVFVAKTNATTVGYAALRDEVHSIERALRRVVDGAKGVTGPTTGPS